MTERGAYATTRTDHRNGHHSGRDRSCLHCWVRAALGRTPKAQRPTTDPEASR